MSFSRRPFSLLLKSQLRFRKKSIPEIDSKVKNKVLGSGNIRFLNLKKKTETGLLFPNQEKSAAGMLHFLRILL